MYCKKCGKEIADASRYCQHCGCFQEENAGFTNLSVKGKNGFGFTEFGL